MVRRERRTGSSETSAGASPRDPRGLGRGCARSWLDARWNPSRNRAQLPVSTGFDGWADRSEIRGKVGVPGDGWSRRRSAAGARRLDSAPSGFRWRRTARRTPMPQDAAMPEPLRRDLPEGRRTPFRKVSRAAASSRSARRRERAPSSPAARRRASPRFREGSGATPNRASPTRPARRRPPKPSRPAFRPAAPRFRGRSRAPTGPPLRPTRATSTRCFRSRRSPSTTTGSTRS